MDDFAAFWRADELAHRDNCFAGTGQTAFGIRMSEECVFAELKEEGTPWAPIPREKRLDLNKRYNDKAEKIVGLRLLRETLPPVDSEFPYVKRIGELFGGQYLYRHDTEWLSQAAGSGEELSALLDRVEKTDLRAFMLPGDWETEKRRIFEKYGLRPSPLRCIRGPVTLACSIFGAENLIFLILDEPELAARFSKVIGDAIIGMSKVMDEEAGTESLRGFAFCDDNCCLLSPEMYEFFGYPIPKRVFDVFSPDPSDERYQHSDSAMGHLLPILGRLNLTGVNFGPTVLTPAIRASLPSARIDGCISPIDFMYNDREALIRQVTRDFWDGQEYGGVNITTAGSINNGSSLDSMRLMMETVWSLSR